MFFFKSKEKYEAKTSVMADLFTLTYTPPPHSEQATHSTEAKFLVAEFDADFESVEKVVKNAYEESYLHKSVGIMYFYNFQYCVQKFSAL
jgi:hypothetical protein